MDLSLLPYIYCNMCTEEATVKDQGIDLVSAQREKVPMKIRLQVCILASLFLLPACGGGTSQSRAKAAPPVDAQASEDEESVRVSLAKTNGWEIRQFDLNRDERADVYKFFTRGPDPKREGEETDLLMRKEVDLNHDGRVDVIQLFDVAQNLVEEHTDLDFDGRKDEITHYSEGVILRREIDLNYDGRTDITKKYTAGTLTVIESDRSGDGRTDTWEYFENGLIDRIGTDINGDGTVDEWEQKAKAADAETPAEGEQAPAEGEEKKEVEQNSTPPAQQPAKEASAA